MEAYIVFEGGIEQQSVLQFQQAIATFSSGQYEKIIIFFSSLGGNIYEGFLLASIIQNSKIPIQVHATNHIDSIANVIYMSGKERTSESYTKFYLHGASRVGNFDERSMIDALSDIRTNNSRIAYFISENSNLTLKKVNKMMMTGTTISAQDALEYNIVHSIKHLEIPQTANRVEIIYIN